MRQLADLVPADDGQFLGQVPGAAGDFLERRADRLDGPGDQPAGKSHDQDDQAGDQDDGQGDKADDALDVVPGGDSLLFNGFLDIVKVIARAQHPAEGGVQQAVAPLGLGNFRTRPGIVVVRIAPAGFSLLDQGGDQFETLGVQVVDPVAADVFRLAAVDDVDAFHRIGPKIAFLAIAQRVEQGLGHRESLLIGQQSRVAEFADVHQHAVGLFGLPADFLVVLFHQECFKVLRVRRGELVEEVQGKRSDHGDHADDGHTDKKNQLVRELLQSRLL